MISINQEKPAEIKTIYRGHAVQNLPKGFFCVRKTWERKKTQIALFKSLDMARNCVNHNPAYSVFDENGNCVYRLSQAS